MTNQLVDENTALLFHDTQEYPLYMHHVRQRLPNVSFPQSPDEDTLASYGYAVVRPVAPPAYDAESQTIEQGAPELNADDEYEQTWVVRARTAEEASARLDELRGGLKSQLLALRTQQLLAGYEFVKPDSITNEKAVVRLRDGDRTHLLGLHVLAAKANPQRLFKLRTAAGENLETTAEELIAITEGALERYNEIMERYWELVEEIDTAPTAADLPTIPTTLE